MLYGSTTLWLKVGALGTKPTWLGHLIWLLMHRIGFSWFKWNSIHKSRGSTSRGVSGSTPGSSCHMSLHTQLISFFHFIRLWTSLVMLARWGHLLKSKYKESKRRKEAMGKVNKHKLLLSVFLLWQERVNESASPFATAAAKGGNSSAEPVQVWAQLHPHHSFTASDPPGKH